MRLMPPHLPRLLRAFSSGSVQHLPVCRASTCVARAQSCHFEATRSLLCQTVAGVETHGPGRLRHACDVRSLSGVCPDWCVVLSVVRTPQASHTQGYETCSATWARGSATPTPCGALSASLVALCRVAVSSECIGLAKSLQKVVSKYL